MFLIRRTEFANRFDDSIIQFVEKLHVYTFLYISSYQILPANHPRCAQLRTTKPAVFVAPAALLREPQVEPHDLRPGHLAYSPTHKEAMNALTKQKS